MYLLAVPTNQNRMGGHVEGTAYVGLNLRDVRSIPLPVPTPPLQERIVDEVNKLLVQAEQVRVLQAKTAAELDALLLAILDQAYKGVL